MSYISAIGTANPLHGFSQSAIADFMVKAMQLTPEASRKLRTIFKASGIEKRYAVLDDYGKTDQFSFYPNAPQDPFPSTETRLLIFRDTALPLSVAAVNNLAASHPQFDPGTVTHLVVVCCTGMYAPGLDIELVHALKLPSTVQRTAVTFMGCYAAFNAIKIADAFCAADSNSRVLIVCTELCSLHFQRQATDDNMLANALFGDGSAALLVEGKRSGPLALSIEAFHNDLAIDNGQAMAWAIGDAGFEMKLSTYVPNIIREGIGNLTERLLAKISRRLSDVRYFAIHPGGRKILEAIEQRLGLTKEQNSAAYSVLRQFGNMSSPTVLFVLHEISKGLTTQDDGEHVLSFAFGPGLTLESMLLKIESD